MAKDMKSNMTGATQASAAELYDFLRRVRACARWLHSVARACSRAAAGAGPDARAGARCARARW